MAGFLLTRSSVIICPHGGIVSHIPTTTSEYRINGQMLLLMTDQYVVVGCPMFQTGPCLTVSWTTASVMMLVRGVPALTTDSIGLCMSASGAPSGPAVVVSHQTIERDPETLKNVD